MYNNYNHNSLKPISLALTMIIYFLTIMTVYVLGFRTINSDPNAQIVPKVMTVQEMSDEITNAITAPLDSMLDELMTF